MYNKLDKGIIHTLVVYMQEIGYSKYYLTRNIIKEMGLTISEYIRKANTIATLMQLI